MYGVLFQIVDAYKLFFEMLQRELTSWHPIFITYSCAYDVRIKVFVLLRIDTVVG